MPQFNPEEEVVAIATFPTKPAGLECTAELWLASDLNKAATSGVIPFIATGEDQSISLPIASPGVEGTYPVYLEVFSNGQRIAVFRGDEDVTIKPLALLSTSGWGNIEILEVNGQSLINVNGNEAALAVPVVVSNIAFQPVTLRIRNLSLPAWDRWGNKAIQMRYSLGSSAPQFLATVQLPREVPMIWDPTIPAWVRDPSIEVLMTIPFGFWYGGSWSANIPYSAEFQWGLLDTAEQQYAPMGNNFIIRNMVRCTAAGSWGLD